MPESHKNIDVLQLSAKGRQIFGHTIGHTVTHPNLELYITSKGEIWFSEASADAVMVAGTTQHAQHFLAHKFEISESDAGLLLAQIGRSQEVEYVGQHPTIAEWVHHIEAITPEECRQMILDEKSLKMDEHFLNLALDFKTNPDKEILIDPHGMPHFELDLDDPEPEPHKVMQSKLASFVASKCELSLHNSMLFLKAIGKNNETKIASEWANYFGNLKKEDVLDIIKKADRSMVNELLLDQALSYRSKPDDLIRIKPDACPYIMSGQEGSKTWTPHGIMYNQLATFVTATFPDLTMQDGSFFMKAVGKKDETKTAAQWAEYFGNLTKEDVLEAIAPYKQKDVNYGRIKTGIKIVAATTALVIGAVKCSHGSFTEAEDAKGAAPATEKGR